jgi:hypothetical protein
LEGRVRLKADIAGHRAVWRRGGESDPESSL